jgi:hypothetical protein
MSKTKSSTTPPAKLDRRRFDQAQQDLARMQDEIAPFIPKRESYRAACAGEMWRSTRSTLRESAARVSKSH